MKIRYIFTVFFVALIFATCGKENEIGNPTELPLDVSIPQGLAPAEVDQRIVDFYNKYNTFLIYDYTSEEVAWKLVGGPASLSTYSMPKADPSKVGGQLDLFQEIFFDFYPDEFLKKYLPYKIFLADQMLFYMSSKWNEWGSYAVGMNMVFGFGRVDYELPVDSMYIAFNFVNRDFLTLLKNNSKLTFPDNFFEITNYIAGVTAPTRPQYVFPAESRFKSIYIPNDIHLDAGVFEDVRTSTNIDTNKSTDVFNYLTYMRYFPKGSPQWTRYLSFPKVKAKYDLLVDYWLKTYGYNPHDLGEADFGEIVIP